MGVPGPKIRYRVNAINLSIEILFYHEKHEVHEDIRVLNFVFFVNFVVLI